MNDFRSEENRAHNKERSLKTMDTFSGFCEEATPGQTIWGHKFLEDGTIEDLNIFVDRLLNTREFPIIIKISKKDDSLLEVSRDLNVGDNVFYNQSISSGDRLIISTREGDYDATPKAKDVFITFIFKK